MNLTALDTAVRALVIVALAYASLVAITLWAVRARKLSPFGVWPRAVRRISDPVLLRLERRVIAAGGNPQNSPLWLVGLVIACGLVLISLTQWLIGVIAGLTLAVRSGPRIWLRLVVSAVFTILMAALLIRVIASWFGIGPYNRWMRPIIALTGWLIDPIRRIMPPFGMIDFSPMVAWLVLYVVRGFVLGLI
jgi:YggT family protein